ncbi:type II secretion system protein GspL [Pacificoceanicola onchidii]|uniref:type II secretion system protein GspL n=1 Tax=Pacificoceanicola onchidii TaxID=2562685 RepID=UPI0010A59C91|nr:type II secretion system protein GspL [Pacificoceanicola onchidii]
MAKTRQNTAQSDDGSGFVRLGGKRASARQVVLVPGSAVPLVALDLPDRLRGQAREQVAQRQLSDRLGLRAEQIAMRPFSVQSKAKKSGEAWSRVIAADKAWLETLRDEPGRAVLPDYLSLPTAPGLWTVQEVEADGHPQVMIRFGPSDGLTAQPALALSALRQALVTQDLPKAIYAPGNLPDGLEALAETANVPVFTDAKALTKAKGSKPVVLGHGELACDLRKNPMAARARLARRVLPWRWTAVAALLAGGLWAGLQWFELDRTERQTQAVSQATTSMVQQVFTGNAPVLDARLQVSRALADLQAGQDVDGEAMDALDLVHNVSLVLTGARIVPELLDYRSGEDLRLIARLPDFAAGDRLADALRAGGLRVDLRDSRTEDGETGVRTEFAIAPAEAVE